MPDIRFDAEGGFAAANPNQYVPTYVEAPATARREASQIEYFGGRRLRVRAVNEDGALLAAVMRAVRNGAGTDARTGGSVCNSYGYRAETEIVACAALVDGRTIRAVRRVGRANANKAGDASACRLLDQIRPWHDGRMKVTPERSAALITYLRGQSVNGRVSPTGRTFAVAGIRAWARGRFAWGTSSRPIADALAPKVAERLLRQLIARRSESWSVIQDSGRTAIREDGTGELWHLGDLLPATIARALSSAGRAFAERAAQRRQIARNADLDATLSSRGDRIWVTVQDSISTGNCPVGTSSFAGALAAAHGAAGEIGAATAASVLAIRDDSYTRRACRAAALRRTA